MEIKKFISLAFKWTRDRIKPIMFLYETDITIKEIK